MHDSIPPRPSNELEPNDSAASIDVSGVGGDIEPAAVFEWLERDVRPAVDERINDRIDDSAFSDRLGYQIRTGGKRLRPGLTLTVAEACGLERDRALNLAAGIEMIHSYSLVHDDLTDGDRIRREEPSFWVEFGEADAINIGDMLLTHALETLPEPVTERALTTVRVMTEGQQMDLDFTNRRDCTVNEYLEMVWRKTGVLFNLCIAGSQLMSDTTLGLDREALGRLWQAFQIRDDLLDLQPGNGREMVGNDIREGKRTLMVVHADDTEIYDILDAPPDETTDDNVMFVRDRFESHGSIDFARRQMRAGVKSAADALTAVPSGPHRDRLAALCEYAVARGTDSQGK